MSAVGFTLALGVAFVSGWFACSYYEQQTRLDAERVARMAERAEREDERRLSYLRGVDAGRVEWADVERAKALHPTTHPLGHVARIFDQEAN